MARQHPSNPEGRKLYPPDRLSVSCSKQECQKCLLGLLQTSGKLMNIKGCEPTASSVVQKTRRAAMGGNGKRREKQRKTQEEKNQQMAQTSVAQLVKVAPNCMIYPVKLEAIKTLHQPTKRDNKFLLQIVKQSCELQVKRKKHKKPRKLNFFIQQKHDGVVWGWGNGEKEENFLKQDLPPECTIKALWLKSDNFKS